MSPSGGCQTKDRVTEVYQHHAPAIAAYVLRRTTSDDAPDIVAETFLVAWRRREVLPPEPDTLPWLYGVARNVLANQHRSNRRRSNLANLLVSQFVHHEFDPPSVETAEEFSRVARALRQLADEDAEILRLTSWEGLTPREIATVLEIEPGAARQRLHRARRRLRAKLGPDSNGETDGRETNSRSPATGDGIGRPDDSRLARIDSTRPALTNARKVSRP